MKAKHIMATTVVLVMAGSVFAQETNQLSGQTYATPTKTRAQVNDELLQARERTQRSDRGDDIFYPYEVFIPTPPPTREQVREETLRARELNQLVQGDNVSYPNEFTVEAANTRSRAEVHREAVQARQNKQFDPSYDIGA